MKVIVDFYDEDGISLRVEVEDKYIIHLESIVKKVKEKDESSYTLDDLQNMIEEEKIPVKYIDSEPDYKIYW